MLQYWLDKMQANGTRFINISPVRNDLSAVPDAEWLAIRRAPIPHCCWP